MARVFSAGGVVFKKDKQAGWVWLIAKHAGYHKWVLPKGKVEKGEKGLVTAAREVEEEVGVKTKPVLKKPIHTVNYSFWDNYAKSGIKQRVNKTVIFYLLKYTSGSIESHDQEMEEVAFLPFNQALKRLAFQGERESLEKAQAYLEGCRSG